MYILNRVWLGKVCQAEDWHQVRLTKQKQIKVLECCFKQEVQDHYYVELKVQITLHFLKCELQQCFLLSHPTIKTSAAEMFVLCSRSPWNWVLPKTTTILLFTATERCLLLSHVKCSVERRPRLPKLSAIPLFVYGNWASQLMWQRVIDVKMVCVAGRIEYALPVLKTCLFFLNIRTRRKIPSVLLLFPYSSQPFSFAFWLPYSLSIPLLAPPSAS